MRLQKWLILSMLLGGIIGGLSLLLFPRAMIHSAPLRIANFFIAPVASGGLSWWLASWRRNRGETISPGSHFWTAFWFVIAFAGIRLVYASH